MYVLEEKPEPNRTRVEILAKILQVASSSTLKTHIMYRANLSHRQLEKYLALLQEKGLLEQVVGADGRMYRATSKGYEFLKDYERLNSHLITIGT
ncbi:MAG: winged helix-turn-helix domain-containing protein [Candidatus Bathyarchaeia archaeon]|jgi:predicted transcriptional regulator